MQRPFTETTRSGPLYDYICYTFDVIKGSGKIKQLGLFVKVKKYNIHKNLLSYPL